MPVMGKTVSTADLLKKSHTNNNNNNIDPMAIGGKENQRKSQRDGLMTDRARAGTLSPSNPEIDRRVSGNLTKSPLVVWNDKEEPYISKYIDYSNKYGIGFMLTNDSCGVYFNDNSKMLLYPDNINIDYSEKLASRQEVREKYSIKNYP